MNGLIFYLFEASLCLMVLYAIYWSLLRQETFFRLNRFYLLAMIICSVLLPMLPLKWTPAGTTAPIVVMLEPVLITPGIVKASLQTHTSWLEMGLYIYLTGVVLLLFRFLWQLLQLFSIARKARITRRQGHRVVLVDRPFSPFSFFNMIFINESVVPAGALPTILEHEKIHIRQRHTLDMVLIEMATFTFWFNPVLWMTRREMKRIHEYLADEGVLQNGTNRSEYQQMILNETMGVQVNTLTNNFNVSLLKKRIAMMTKSKSGSRAKLKALLALPVLLGLSFLLSANTYTHSIALKVQESASLAVTNTGPVAVPLVQEKQKQVKYVAPVVTEKEVFTVVEKMPTYPGGQDAMSKFLVENIKYPETAMKNNIQGKVFVTFVVRNDGTIANAKIIRGIGSGCDEEALRVVMLMPKWNPGTQKGKPVDVQFTLPINFVLEGDKKEVPKK